MRILIAEDEKDLNQIITNRLKGEHYSVDSCFDGQEALEYLESAEYDAVVLDIMMPVLDGLSVLKKMRRRNDSTPVILLTAKDSIEDRVAGLDAGANDYLVKPFAFEELLARIRVLLRKPAEIPKTCYKVADLEVHMDTQQVKRGGKDIKLSGKEFALLRYMVQNKNPNQSVSHRSEEQYFQHSPVLCSPAWTGWKTILPGCSAKTELPATHMSEAP